MSDAITGTVDFFSKVATIGAFGATIATFAILHKSTRKNEQYRIANEISKSFAEVEYKIIETPVEKEKELEKLRKHPTEAAMTIVEVYKQT